jgi:hypothetical protein
MRAEATREREQRSMTTRFRAEVVEMVRKAVEERRWNLLYVMIPADDGGQSYEMKCKICGEFGNILAIKFVHASGCPVDIEEQRLFARSGT